MSALFLPYRTLNGECATGIMTFRERVEALSIRPIADISHGANPSLNIHLLPNAGTDRNVRSFEYLAAPAVDQCIVRQYSSLLHMVSSGGAIALTAFQHFHKILIALVLDHLAGVFFQVDFFLRIFQAAILADLQTASLDPVPFFLIHCLIPETAVAVRRAVVSHRLSAPVAA